MPADSTHHFTPHPAANDPATPASVAHRCTECGQFPEAATHQTATAEDLRAAAVFVDDLGEIIDDVWYPDLCHRLLALASLLPALLAVADAAVSLIVRDRFGDLAALEEAVRAYQEATDA